MVKNQKDEKDRINNILILIALLVIIFCACLSIYIYINRPFEVRSFDVEFKVNQSIGFDVNSSLLRFGVIVPGGLSTRTILFDNDYDFPLYGKFLVSPNIKSMISAPENFTIPAKNTTSIDVTLYVPKDYPYGIYKGKIKVEMRR